MKTKILFSVAIFLLVATNPIQSKIAKTDQSINTVFCNPILIYPYALVDDYFEMRLSEFTTTLLVKNLFLVDEFNLFISGVKQDNKQIALNVCWNNLSVLLVYPVDIETPVIENIDKVEMIKELKKGKC